MCSRNVDFHGAGSSDLVLDVDAMLRWSTRVMAVRREVALEAMIASLADQKDSTKVSCIMCT